jgi:mediator of RNA polymerase II transcription subunit 18
MIFPRRGDGLIANGHILERPLDFDKLGGTLRWNDLPDATSARPTTNGRAIVEINNEKGLPTILKSINHRHVFKKALLKMPLLTLGRFVREFIKEGYRFVHGNVLFELFRMIPLHPQGEISNLGNPLPSYNSLSLFDADNKYALMASIKVDLGMDRTETSQKLNKQATAELVAVKMAFEGSDINLKIVDRLSFDTRVKG